MANALVDTSIIVDLLRNYEPAKHWFVTQQDLVVSRVVWLEIIEGACHRLQVPILTRNLRHFTPLVGSLAQQPY